MYKPLLAADGYTTALLLFSSYTVAVDSALYIYVASKLFAGDWGYLRIQDDANTEIVKVFQVIGGNSLAIIRGMDGTVPSVFRLGASVSYIDTAVGVLDSIAVPALQLIALGGIAINGGEISYPDIDIEVLGSAEVAGTVILLKVEVGACCDLTPNLPPPLPEFAKYRITDANDYRGTGDNDYRVWA